MTIIAHIIFSTFITMRRNITIVASIIVFSLCISTYAGVVLQSKGFLTMSTDFIFFTVMAVFDITEIAGIVIFCGVLWALAVARVEYLFICFRTSADAVVHIGCLWVKISQTF